MFSRKMSALILAGAAGCTLCTSANAIIVYSTDFNAPLYANGPLIGQDGWVITGASVVSPENVANQPNGNVALTTTGQDVNRPYLPAITAPPATSVYLSADFTVNSAQAAGDYFIHLSDGGTAAFNARVYVRLGSSAGLFQMALATGSGAVASYGADLAMGTTYRFVAEYDIVAGATNDTGTLFVGTSLVDPIYGIGDVPYVAAVTTGADAGILSALCLRQGTASSAPTVVVDNIDVAYVPGPASLSLLAFGGLLASRRRRA